MAVLAAAPAVGAAETAPSETVAAEQLPPAPDPAPLLELQACLTELEQLLVGTPPPAPAPPAGEAEADEQQPPVTPPAPAPPDPAALTETCKKVLQMVQGSPPAPAPAPAPAAEEPAIVD
ncbi:hypothetical protein [Glycomyces tarimensis]